MEQNKFSKSVDELIKDNAQDYTSKTMLEYLKQCEEEYKEELRVKAVKEKHSQLMNDLITAEDNKQEPEKLATSHNRDIFKENITRDYIMNIKKYYVDVLVAENDEELEIALPSTDDPNYQKIINLVLLKLLKDLNDMYAMQPTLSDAEKQDLVSDITIMEEKIELIMDLRDYVETEEPIDESKPIHVIFVPSNNQEIQLERDIDNIPKEYYPDIKKFVNDLSRNGIEKYKYVFNVKCQEARKGQVRFYYSKYITDTATFFIAIATTLKKTSTNRAYYREYFNAMKVKFDAFYNNVIPALSNPDEAARIIVEHEQHLGRIMQKLEEGYKYERNN